MSSELNLKEWKEHADLITDSLWLIDNRDNSGHHTGDYHGNFVPQIPNQLIRRFTKPGDTVIDAFLGSGTTLIETKRLGRNGIGVELLGDVANKAASLIDSSESTLETFQEIIVGDSAGKLADIEADKLLKKNGEIGAKLLILHPPYHDIVKFSNKKEDLSNAATLDEFLRMYGRVVANFARLITKGGYLAVVIGDKYTNSEWVPLGFYVMDQTIKSSPDFFLKSTIIKNMVNNRAKRNQESLWRYRALAGGFYIFRHEYIFLFKKR